jgi:cyclopropane fatty-acyl-phospholipid synthase-like methyltransferase
MPRPTLILWLLGCLSFSGASPQQPNRVWEEQYRTKTTEQMVAQFENPARPVFRYRTAIVSMLQLKPGMSVAEIGAGSGFLARLIAAAVAPDGRVTATELDATMVDHMNARAKAENLANFRAIAGQPIATALEPASVDAIAVVDTFSYFDNPREMLASINSALKPGGLMLVVDVPREGQGASQAGIDAEDVIAQASAAGFKRQDEINVVPGHYALRFRRQ